MNEKISRLGDTLKWVKTIKPHLTQFDIQFTDIKELDLFVDYHLIQYHDLINVDKKDIEIIIRIHSSVLCVNELVSVLANIDVVTHLFIQLTDEHDIVDVDLFGRNIEFIYVDMCAKHCAMLKDESFACRILKLHICILDVPFSPALPIHICLDHIHPCCELLNISTNTCDMTISSPHKITHFAGLVDFYVHDKMGPLLSSFSNCLSMHHSKMEVVNIRDSSVFWSVYAENFWYQLAKLLPETVEYYIGSCNGNDFMIFIQTLVRDLKCKVTLMAWDRYSHLVSRIMSLLEDIPMVYVYNYNGDYEIEEARNVGEIWNLMEDIDKTIWMWLRYVR
jgi:hypothetical protein